MRQVWWIWRDDVEDDDLLGLEESKWREGGGGGGISTHKPFLIIAFNF